jgi:hypothetical protein
MRKTQIDPQLSRLAPSAQLGVISQGGASSRTPMITGNSPPASGPAS